MTPSITATTTTKMILPARKRLLTISRAINLLQTTQSITPTELASYCHNLASYGDGHTTAVPPQQHQQRVRLNAFSHLLPLERVLEQARESEDRIRGNRSKGPLDGIPVSIKGNIAVRELPLTAGSDILTMATDGGDGGGDGGCGYDSYVVRRLLRESGAILIGLTNMDEFGMGSLGTNLNSRRRQRRHDNNNDNDGYDDVYDDGYTKNPLPYMNHHQNHHEIDTNDTWIHRIKTLSLGPALLPPPTTPIPPRSPGGSSSGSAVSVSHGSSLASIGTDTGGSIRLPAAWCGVVGMKPTYGLVSRFGVVAYASSLDTVGVVGGSAECCGLVLDELIHRGEGDGVGVRDATAVFYPGGPLCRGIRDVGPSPPAPPDPRPLEGVRVGIPAAFSIAECPPEIERAWMYAVRTLESYGAATVVVPAAALSPRSVRNSLPAYYVLACAEASSNLARYDGLRYGTTDNDSEDSSPSDGSSTSKTPLERRYSGTRARGFGPEVLRRVLCGTAVLSSDRFDTHYEAASRVRDAVSSELEAAFRCPVGDGGGDGVDLMLVPTALTPPPRLPTAAPGGGDGDDDATEAFVNDVMTVPISLAGLPSISVPVYLDRVSEEGEGEEEEVGSGSERYNGVVGMQIFGPRFSEEVVLRAAHFLEER